MLVSVFQGFFPELLTQELKSHKTTQSLKATNFHSGPYFKIKWATQKKKYFGLVHLFLKLENHTAGTKFEVHISSRRTVEILVKNTKAHVWICTFNVLSWAWPETEKFNLSLFPPDFSRGGIRGPTYLSSSSPWPQLWGPPESGLARCVCSRTTASWSTIEPPFHTFKL